MVLNVENAKLETQEKERTNDDIEGVAKSLMKKYKALLAKLAKY